MPSACCRGPRVRARAPRAASNVSAANRSRNGSCSFWSRSAKVISRCWNWGKRFSALPTTLRRLRRDSGIARKKPSTRMSPQNRTARAAAHAHARKGKRVENQDQDNRCRQRRPRQNRGAAQRDTQAQTPLQLPDVGIELVPCAHGSSACVPKISARQQRFRDCRRKYQDHDVPPEGIRLLLFLTLPDGRGLGSRGACPCRATGTRRRWG